MSSSSVGTSSLWGGFPVRIPLPPFPVEKKKKKKKEGSAREQLKSITAKTQKVEIEKKEKNPKSRAQLVDHVIDPLPSRFCNPSLTFRNRQCRTILANFNPDRSQKYRFSGLHYKFIWISPQPHDSRNRQSPSNFIAFAQEWIRSACEIQRFVADQKCLGVARGARGLGKEERNDIARSCATTSRASQSQPFGVWLAEEV